MSLKVELEAEELSVLEWCENQLAIADLKVEGDREPREAGSPRSWKRRENRFSPRGSKKEYKPAHTLILVKPSQPSDLQNGKILNLHCFKPLNLC